MKGKMAITGSSGTIGTVMMRELTDYEIVPLDLPQVDVRNYGAVLEAIKGCRAVIHLAWNLKDDNWDTGKISPDNDVMTFNVYEACLRGGVSRVITASSVHADNFMKWNEKGLMNTATVPIPTSPYGANKVFLEALGRFYAQEGLEVVCVRFGSVSKEDVPGTKGWDWRKVWLSHRDLGSMIRNCIEAEKIPNNYVVLYAVSNNALRVHDWSNPLNWVPQDNAYASK
jgi:nucleoside-diphosphate-sugar epimerase